MTRRTESTERGEKGDTAARTEFLVSFLVDARGGTMTACRKSGITIAIPPRAAEQPVRVTCRQLRPEAVLHPPPLSEGEGLATNILQFTPAQFLSPVLVAVPHFTPVTAEREVVVYRCEAGKKWSLHTSCPADPQLAQYLTSYHSKVKGEERRVEVVSKSLPQYLALVSRPRLQTISLGPEGGWVSSALAPGLQAHFPPKALTKPVNVGLSVCQPRPAVLSDLTVQGGVVSPVITIEPRRRKFHKPISITIPIPHLKQDSPNGDPRHLPLRDNMSIEMSLLLLCSMSEAGSRAAWEDVTHSTPFTINQGCLQFTSVVSAAFWLVNLPKWMAADAIPMLDKIFRSMSRVPYIVRISIFWRPADPEVAEGCEADVRVIISTEQERTNETSLEFREGFKCLTTSDELEVYERSEIELKLRGNLVKTSESGRLNFKPFLETRITVGIRRGQGSLAAAGHLDLSTEEGSIYSTSLLLPIKKKSLPTSRTA